MKLTTLLLTLLFISLLTVQAQTNKLPPPPLPSPTLEELTIKEPLKAEAYNDPCDALSSGLGVFGTRGTVIEVLNGDTIKILSDNKIQIVHLAGIDAPEKKQEFGHASQQHLADLVLDRDVFVLLINAKPGRGKEIAGIVFTVEENQTFDRSKQANINLEQIRAGMARAKGMGLDDPHLKQELCYYRRAEGEAQAAERGLWQHINSR